MYVPYVHLGIIVTETTDIRAQLANINFSQVRPLAPLAQLDIPKLKMAAQPAPYVRLVKCAQVQRRTQFLAPPVPISATVEKRVAIHVLLVPIPELVQHCVAYAWQGTNARIQRNRP